MLPFLQPRKIASVIIAKHKDGHSEDQPDHKEEHLSAAEALIRAVHSKDASAVASALKEAFKQMDSEPHKEGEHI